MKGERLRAYSHLRRLCLASALGIGLAMTAGVSLGAAQTVVDPDAIAGNSEIVPQLGAFSTTVAYVVQFYPLWFTYYQRQLGRPNRLVGPIRVSPIYHYAVAVNVDTLYASTFLDLSNQPVILTIPATTSPLMPSSYSILTLDPYGNLLATSPSIPKAPGLYALIGPGGFTGTLPAGATRINVPLNYSFLAFRADKFSPNNENEIKQAEAFRLSLKSQTLSDYLLHPGRGRTLILPEAFFSVPFKTAADDLVAHHPIAFLRQLQTAVAAPYTPTLSPYEQALSTRFNTLFANRNGNSFEFGAGARTAHELILDRYLTYTHWALPTRTNWIHFTNIGIWGKHVVERSAITEFLQYGNGIETAAYYHVFKDADGNALDGTNPRGYVLTFPEGELPAATRFWSVTAYTPEAIELVPNLADKYHVAKYTPGLQFNNDGSLSIYMARQLPAGVPMANWLPVPRGAFNIMLRVYGPQGTVENNTYVPPGIEPR